MCLNHLTLNEYANAPVPTSGGWALFGGRKKKSVLGYLGHNEIIVLVILHAQKNLKKMSLGELRLKRRALLIKKVIVIRKEKGSNEPLKRVSNYHKKSKEMAVAASSASIVNF